MPDLQDGETFEMKGGWFGPQCWKHWFYGVFTAIGPLPKQAETGRKQPKRCHDTRNLQPTFPLSHATQPPGMLWPSP